MKRTILLCMLLAFAMVGCASWFANAAKDATNGSLQAISTPAAQSAVSSIASAAASSAVSQITGTTAQSGVKALASSAAAGVLTPENRDYLVTLAGDIRDEMTGPKLQANLNDALDSAQPHISAIVQDAAQKAALQIKTDADQELPKLEKVLYITLAVLGGAILLVLAILALVLVEMRKARKAS